jgi:hypothetical protein
MTSSVFSAVNRSEAATSPAANEDQGGQGAVKVVAGLERGANGGRQEDLVHLEEQPETDRQDDLSVNAAERQPSKRWPISVTVIGLSSATLVIACCPRPC